MNPGLLTADAAATYLGMGRKWLYRETAAGRIAVVNVGRNGRNKRWAVTDLDAYIAAHREPVKSRLRVAHSP